MKKNNSGATTLRGKMEGNLFESQCSSAHGANEKRAAKLKNT